MCLFGKTVVAGFTIDAHLMIKHQIICLLEQPGLYPDQETKRRLFPLDVLPEKHAEMRNQVWQHFRQGS